MISRAALLRCALVSLVVALLPSAASATTLFSDDFGPKPLGSWTPSPLGLSSNWDGSNGTAAYNGGGHTQLYAGDPEWEDYTVEAAFRLQNGNNHPGGIRGRVNPATGAGYAAWLYPSEGVIKLLRATAWHIDTSGLTVVAQTSVGSISANTFHTLSLTFDGDDISVGFDSSTVIQTTDSTLTAGVVALDVSNQPIEFDDVEVRTLGGSPTVLFSDDFSPRPLRNWTASPLGLFSHWDASSGVASYDGGGHTQIHAGDTAWTDYKVEAKFRLQNGNNYPGGIRGRVNLSTGASYAAWIYPSQGVLKLFRVVAWDIDTTGLTLLQEVSVGSIATSTFHTLALVFEGNRISLVYNGSTLAQVNDSTYSAGAVALDVSNQPIDFDDVTVTTLPEPPPTALFSDNFNNESLSNWTASPLGNFSHWSAANATASYDGSGHTQIYAGDDEWTDYKVEAKFLLQGSGSNYPGGLAGRVDTSTGERYTAWIYPNDGKIKLWRSVAWNIDTTGLTQLGEANVTITSGLFHTLAISFEDDLITVFYEGTPVIQVTDSTLAAGAIALDVSERLIDWDDVLVTTVGAADAGPGGPILVLAGASNPFGRYLGEILLAEGLNQYKVRDISTVSATTLAAYDVIVLGETSLTSGQVTMLSDWVDDGGNLIAMRPDAQLATLLGLSSQSSTLANGYLLVNTSQAPGQGIVGETIQFHGTADLWTASNTTTVATLYSDASTSTSSPALTLRSVGSNGGQAAAFTYDLARSVVTTRQGNPAWAGQERDGTAPIRPNDLFFGNASGDPQTDWINLNKVAIPQADEQQRLLANLILHMASDRKPLPRFWYFPRGEKAVVLMTGDDHANGGTTGRFQGYQADSPSNCSVADWECVRGTSYIYPNTSISDTTAAAFVADGFEIAVHINTNCANWTPSSLDTFYTNQIAQWQSNFPSLPAPATNRTHCIAWSDWVSQAEVSLAHGIRLDTNYYYWPGSWIQDRPGFMTGSGMPMRFADTDGTRIDVYQAATQMTDESGQTFPDTIDELLDKALGSEGYYGVFTANMHTDSSSSSGSDAIVDAALTAGVPVVSAQQMLTWLDGRNGSSFQSISWSSGTLTFTVSAATGSNGLRAMVPATSTAGSITGITSGGNAVSYTTETIKGVSYAVFAAGSGTYAVTYAN